MCVCVCVCVCTYEQDLALKNPEGMIYYKTINQLIVAFTAYHIHLILCQTKQKRYFRPH